jgi:hypothetical protein
MWVKSLRLEFVRKICGSRSTLRGCISSIRRPGLLSEQPPKTNVDLLRAASDHAAAVPAISVVNSRRRMYPPKLSTTPNGA